MGTSTLIVVSVLSAIEILVILGSVDEHLLKVFLGNKLWIDLFYGLGVMIYMGLSGTISGVIISTFSAFFMTITLAAAANMIGYRKRKTLADGTIIWVEYPAKWTVASIKKLMLTLKDKSVAEYNKLSEKLNKPATAVEA